LCDIQFLFDKKIPARFLPPNTSWIRLRFWVPLMDLPPLVSGGVLRRIALLPPVFGVLPLPVLDYR